MLLKFPNLECYLHLTIGRQNDVIRSQLGKSVKSIFLITVKEISNMAEDQVLVIVPHVSAAGTITRIVQAVPCCLHQVGRICKEVNKA